MVDLSGRLAFWAVAVGIFVALAVLVAVAERKPWDVKVSYHIGTYFYRKRYNRRLSAQRALAPAHVLQSALGARPSTVSPMAEAESRFFFLREIELNAGVELTMAEAGTVAVSKKNYRKLEEYFSLEASKKSASPHAAFAHYGMALQIIR